MMEEDQKEKCYLCKFCKQSFSNGKKLGGHMRGHLALIAASKKQGIAANYEEAINGKMGLEFDDAESKKSADKMGLDEHSGANGYGLRENPKKSWRISDSKQIANPSKDHYVCGTCGKGFHSPRALAGHLRSHSLKGKESTKRILCRKCGKGFDSAKAMYGHLRWHSSHSNKRSRQSDESTSSSLSVSSEEEDVKLDGGATGEMANPIRKKRSCTRYKPAKTDNLSACSSLSSFVSISGDNDDGAEEGAICLMMLSRGVRTLDGVQLVITNQTEFAASDSMDTRTVGRSIDFEVSVDGSMEVCTLESQSELDLKEVWMTECGSGQLDMGLVRCNLAKQQSGNGGKGKAYEDDQVETDSETLKDLPEQEIQLKRRSKDHKCSICFKEFGSGQALGGHMRAHYNPVTTDGRAKEETDDLIDFPDIHGLYHLNHLEQGTSNGGIKLNWIGSDTEWDPLLMVN